MSTSCGNVHGLIIMALIGHFLPDDEAVLPCQLDDSPVITKTMTDGQIIRTPAASQTLAEAMLL